MRQRGQAGRSAAERVGDDTADSELAVRAAGGELLAFEELYRRHVQAAWRVAQAITGNPHDAADAVSESFTRVFQALPTRLQGGGNFRSYLLASVRNASIDVLRRVGRTAPSNNEDVLDGPAVGREPSDLLLADVDSDMVAEAFRGLPERWRTVLWLTEVENMPLAEVAELLGVSANGVAQLAVRARAGLRQRFLQAHLRQGEVRKECRATVANLGAYAADSLAARDISKVDQHLAGCGPCRERVGELQDLSQTLHRSILPLPIFLATAVTGKWLAASGAGKLGGSAGGAAAAGMKVGTGAGAAKTAGAGAGAMAAKAGAGAGAGVAAATSAVGGTASLAVASVALFAASLLTMGGVDTAGRAPSQESRRPSPQLAVAVPEDSDGALSDPLADYPIAGVEVPPARDARLGAAPPDTSTVTTPDLGAPDTGAGAAQAIPVGEPMAHLGMWLPGPLALVLALGEATTACPGVRIGAVALGCSAEEPGGGSGGDGATLITGGTALPETTTTVPAPADTPAPTPAVKRGSSVPSDGASEPAGPIR